MGRGSMIEKNKKTYIDIFGARVVQGLMFFMIFVFLLLGTALTFSEVSILGPIFVSFSFLFLPLIYIFQRFVHLSSIRKVKVGKDEVILYYKSQTVRIPYDRIYFDEFVRENDIKCHKFHTMMNFKAHAGEKRGIFNSGYLDDHIRYELDKKYKSYMKLDWGVEYRKKFNKLYRKKVMFWERYLDYYVWYMLPFVIILAIIITLNDNLIFPVLLIVLIPLYTLQYYLTRRFYFGRIPKKMFLFDDRAIVECKWNRHVFIFSRIEDIVLEDDKLIIHYRKKGKTKEFIFLHVDDGWRSIVKKIKGRIG